MDLNNTITTLSFTTKTLYRTSLSVSTDGTVFSYTALEQYTFSVVPVRVITEMSNSTYQVVSTSDGHIHLIYHFCNNTVNIPHC